jgi:hypothetical protein
MSARSHPTGEDGLREKIARAIAKAQEVARMMRAIEATAPNANEGRVFTYGQVERGIRAALRARDEGGKS